MNIQLPECILLDDNEKQVIKDAFLSYIQDLEVKAKKIESYLLRHMKMSWTDYQKLLKNYN